MSYIDKNLMNDEVIIYRAKMHWIIFLQPFIFLAIGILLIPSPVAAIFPLFIAVGIFMLIPAFITFKTYEFALTNKRVIAKFGFIKRRSIDVLLNRVEGILLNQSILGRLLGYGSVSVSGTGGARDPFPMIADPLKLRLKVQEQISNL